MRPDDPMLRALAADPSDDVAWLALADRLEEEDQNKEAELLRLHRRLIAAEPGREKARLSKEVTKRLNAGVRPVGPRLVNSVGMEFALIPAGAFLMGSTGRGGHGNRDETPQHRVEITRPFWFGIYPVTQEQYAAVMGSNPSQFRKGGSRAAEVKGMDTSRFPAEGMSCGDTEEFCRKLSALRAEKGRTYRLPTEAMWEFACRAGGQPNMRFCFGARMTSTQGNIDGTTANYGAKVSARLGRTCQVGMYAPNAWGLYDMHGNVFEWCSDWYGPDYYRGSPVKDPEGPDTGSVRPLRGGAFPYNAFLCRAAYRNHSIADNRMAEHGFRVVLLW
jgi:uncharacterized protein (TIGR02996 family)